jgi:acetyl esterase/lipase
MKRIVQFLACCFALFGGHIAGQSYITPIYAVQKTDSDLVYGTAVDYKGCTQQLHLDIYKPVGSTDIERPLMVLVHGGSFIGGTKQDPTIVDLANEFAARGYVVASVQYRLGMHLRSYVPTPYNLGDPNIMCAYAHSSEVERAAFRGMQDVKGAIRFMKNRAAQDSTSADLVTVGGESAGAIISNLVGFMDDPSERPAACGSIADAPVPASNLPCTLNPCATNSRLRPDMGSIEGDMNLFPNVNANVKAVVSLYGAMFSNLFLINNHPPCRFYAYHQDCDPIVPSDSGGVYRYLDACLYYCSSYTPFQLGVGPQLKGTRAMVGYANNSSWGGTMKSHIVPNGPPPAPCGTCFIALVNPYYSTCHALVDVAGEADSIARFLPPCTTVGLAKPQSALRFSIYPNPTTHEVFIETLLNISEGKIELFNLQGQSLLVNATAVSKQKTRLDLKGIQAGVYFIRYSSIEGTGSRLLVVE